MEASTSLTLVQKALQQEQLENFVDALKLTHLLEMFKSGGPFTVFAPVNEAFLRIPQRVVVAVEENPDTLTHVIQTHIVRGYIWTQDIVSHPLLISIAGDKIPVSKAEGVIRVGQSKLIVGDIAAHNGIIHMVDEVLIPADLQVMKGGATASLQAIA
ncbi:fasciclin domain-containing protein [Omnitrophica bacterium]|nr:fasciclin domain-containing protein [Candidatus Omnitrophota bacterium]